MEYKYQTLSDWARAVGVSRKRAMEWVTQNRIEVYRPAIGVLLVLKTEKRPEKLIQWHKARQERIDRESVDNV